jgi:uncharacterized membrane protein YgcG
MEESDTNEAKDKNEADEKTGLDLTKKIRFYCIIIWWISNPIFVWYFIGLDSWISWQILAVFSLVGGGLLLAHKKGWLDGRGGEGGEGGEGGGDGGGGDGGCGGGE